MNLTVIFQTAQGAADRTVIIGQGVTAVKAQAPATAVNHTKVKDPGRTGITPLALYRHGRAAAGTPGRIDDIFANFGQPFQHISSPFSRCANRVWRRLVRVFSTARRSAGFVPTRITCFFARVTAV